MAVRMIPYGYRMEDGRLGIEPQETETVRWIFTAYLSGRLLSEIAQILTERGETYLPGNAVWNKNKIARIIENKRYTGTEGYPKIIEQAVFERANTLKKSKARRDVPVPESIRAFVGMTVCAECGQPYVRKPSWSVRERWLCRGGCKSDRYLSDHEILSELANAMTVVRRSESLRMPEKAKTYEPNADIIRRTNEIGQMCEQTGVRFELVSPAILECAGAKFRCCRADPARIYNDLVQNVAEQIDDTKPIDEVFLKAAVRRLEIHRDGHITLCLVNGIKVGGGKGPCRLRS